MIREIFEHRSSRVIAIGRIGLGLLFGLWVWIDPDQPVRGGTDSYVLLSAYLGYALLMVPIAWWNWWLDYRLVLPSFLLDAAIFLLALFFTEGDESDIVSGYLAFFAFLTLSAALRWSWRITLATMAVLCLLYVALSMQLHQAGLSDLPYTVFRRASYLMVLSLIVIWFALQRSAPLVAKFSARGARQAATPFEGALDYAMAATGATGAVLAWESSEEPGCSLQFAGTLANRARRVPPGEIDLYSDPDPLLFDRLRGRALSLGRGDLLHGRTRAPAPALAAYLELNTGLSIPVEGTTGSGQIVLVGIAGLSRDYLALGRALAREIAHGLDEEEISSLARESASMRLRGNIARDLHDSVAQSLAGASYRLASLRRQVIEGKDLLPEIDSISDSLKAEQAHIREIIGLLRSNAVNPGERNLGAEIDRLANVLARQWQVQLRCEDAIEPLILPAWLVFEIQQLLREGVANAVRHGGAKTVILRIERSATALSLTIEDDGAGFPDGAPLPQSIAERVAALGGTMQVTRHGADTRIGISLPLGVRP